MKTLWMASVMVLFSAAADAAAVARKSQVIAVLEVRSRLVAADRKLIDGAGLSAQIRDVARRAAPEARIAGDECPGDCELRAARELGADRLLRSELLRADNAFLVSFALYDTAGGKLLSTSSAIATTPEELSEAVEGAVVDLFRMQEDSIVVISMGPNGVPDVPQPPGPLPESAVDFGVDPRVLVAYDNARTVEGKGRERPDEAAAAWREVAEMDGKNPFRELADTRALQWENYADTRRAYQAQLDSDTARLRKLLPQATASEATRIDALVRFARAYGVENASPMLPLLPAGALRERAETALGCEARDASKCLLMAHAADEAKDGKGALEYLDQACLAGSAEACAEAGNRWLRPATRDAARGIAALQRGCALMSATACARLAKVYEEGDGTNSNALLAGEMRDKACAAGDGKSCRQRACSAESDDRALQLWQMGCSRGDATSCALAHLAAPQTSTPADASASSQAAKKDPVQVALSAEANKSRVARERLGATLVGVGVIAAAGVGFMLTHGGGEDFGDHWGRHYVTQANRGASSRGMVYALGAAALLAGGAGVAILLTRPEPEKPRVSVGIAPGALLSSGTLP